jgi:putative hydrolase of the HAD superfamily
MSTSIAAVFFDLGDTLVKSSSTPAWLPGAKALLPSLKSKGFRLGIISNTGSLPSRTAILGLLPASFDINLFEPALVLFSSEVGMEKPKQGIFDLAVTQASVPASNCLYVSENIVETMVAQHAGMRSVRVHTGSSDLSHLAATMSDYLHAVA